MAPPDAENINARFNLLTSEEFVNRVQDGEALIIYNRKVYKVDKWLKYHPGGELALRHLVGKDATDEINAFHPDYVKQKMIRTFYVADYVSDKARQVPLGGSGQLSLSEQERISTAYRRLEMQVRELGLFDCNYMNYMYECIRCVLFLTGAWLLVLYGVSAAHYVAGSILLGMFWHQLAFTAHDAGHSGITHRWFFDYMIGIFVASFCGGLSIGWWKKNHYVHHIVTNHPEHDPDIQHLPFFAVSTRFFQNVYSTYYGRTLKFDAFACVFVRVQHYLYYIVLCFGRFNLYFLALSFLLNEERVPFRGLELGGMVAFWIWYGAFLSFLPSWSMVLACLLVSHAVTMILHLQITLSHFGMSTEVFGPEESFPAKMLRTTMDVDCPWFMDWFHGGLQYQAVHHLFPRLPRHNLRAAQPLVCKFCEEHDLQYHLYGFVKGNGIVLAALQDVANQVALLSRVAQSHGQL